MQTSIDVKITEIRAKVVCPNCNQNMWFFQNTNWQNLGGKVSDKVDVTCVYCGTKIYLIANAFIKEDD